VGNASLTIEWLKSPDQLDRIAGAWAELEAAVQKRTHLSTFDFLAPWYRHYSGSYGGAPLVGLAWRGQRLVGVAPLTVCSGAVARIPVTRIEFAPSDVPAGEFLVDDDQPETVAALIESVVDHQKFDVISLDGFDAGSPQLTALNEIASKRNLPIETTDHAYAVADLRGGYQKYHAGLSGHYRRNLNQKARKMTEAGGGRVEGVRLGGDPKAIEKSVARAIAITEASHKLNGQRLGDDHRGFMLELARRFGARGMLSLPILTIQGRDAAFILGVVERHRFYDITLAYDESFAKLSPGALLMQRTVEQLAAEGVDMVISHGAHDYKKHWATAFVPQKRVFLFAPSLRGAATRFVRFYLAPLWQRVGKTLVRETS
jgi:CelD/BcsL family acetyltransferase involved in cellulose biosynthesis